MHICACISTSIFCAGGRECLHLDNYLTRLPIPAYIYTFQAQQCKYAKSILSKISHLDRYSILRFLLWCYTDKQIASISWCNCGPGILEYCWLHLCWLITYGIFIHEYEINQSWIYLYTCDYTQVPVPKNTKWKLFKGSMKI